MPEDLLSCKDLAQQLRRSTRYVYFMKARGFRMIAGRTTLKAALVWLSVNPQPCARSKK